jgi:O-antigen ligase/tetratricopeptide (TPR) repeat protein
VLRGAAWLGLVLLLVRPLFPCEDGDRGTGLLVDLLWFVLPLLWVVDSVLRGVPLRWHLSAADLPLLGFLAWALVCVWRAAAPGPAWASFLELLALAVAFWSVRQLIAPVLGTSTVLAAFASLSVVLAGYAAYQAFWGLEQVRRYYQTHREEVLRELGIPPGSPEQLMFENRLNSHEPFATFGLANSLAGFLLPWCLVSLGAWLAGDSRPRAARSLPERPVGSCLQGAVIRHAPALASALAAIAVVLTQSRTAYVGLAVGGILTFWSCRRISGRRFLLWLLLILALGCGTFAVGRLRGKFDEKLLTQAWLSLRYRWEYWQATMNMVSDHPLFGVGPGNFRSYYLRYKLENSSEEIGDPHNFLLEVAAATGLVGLCLWLGVFVAPLLQQFGLLGTRTEPALGRPPKIGGLREETVAEPSVADTPAVAWAIGPAATSIAWWAADGSAALYAALALAWVAVFASLRLALANTGTGPMAAALVALGIHLSGAGGIFYPGVAVCLWVLWALMWNPSRACVLKPQVASWIALFAGGSMFGLIGRFYVIPTLTSRSLVADAKAQMAQGHLISALATLRQATEVAPWHVEAWATRSSAELQRIWQASFSDERFLWALEAASGYHKADPQSPWPCRDLAVVWATRAAQTGNPKHWKEALRWSQQALERYPTDLRLGYLHCSILWQAGEQNPAAELAAQLLARDAECPHPDRRLQQAQREQLQRWASLPSTKER